MSPQEHHAETQVGDNDSKQVLFIIRHGDRFDYENPDVSAGCFSGL